MCHNSLLLYIHIDYRLNVSQLSSIIFNYYRKLDIIHIDYYMTSGFINYFGYRTEKTRSLRAIQYPPEKTRRHKMADPTRPNPFGSGLGRVPVRVGYPIPHPSTYVHNLLEKSVLLFWGEIVY